MSQLSVQFPISLLNLLATFGIGVYATQFDTLPSLGHHTAGLSPLSLAIPFQFLLMALYDL